MAGLLLPPAFWFKVPAKYLLLSLTDQHLMAFTGYMSVERSSFDRSPFDRSSFDRKFNPVHSTEVHLTEFHSTENESIIPRVF